uniref:Uncharacterized protein n=1 Tax=Panagrolaimus sp. PS1159 TaxID=55785 RepID=A0AC35GM74_9BILA
MGVLTPPGDDPSLASKPKERQFQVVPVPAVFSRGRWKCCDFREAQLAESGILEFVKPSKHLADLPQNASTIMVTYVAPNQLEALQKQQHLIEDEGKRLENLPDPVMVVPADNLVGGGEPAPHIPPGSAGATMSTQDSTDLLNDLRGSGADVDIHHSASSATINIPVSSASTTKPPGDPTDISAIDSKIEQAMDLVKSHVTFAVRQEVEELKTTITTLQAKVTMLENENQYLKRFAPPDILANLSNLVQNKMPHSVHQAESITSDAQSSSRNLSPAPSEIDEPPITMAAHHSLPPVSHSSRPVLRIPAVASVAMMDGGITPSTPPAAIFPSMGIYEPPGTPGLPRSASAIETTQIQSINENVQEDHTRQMTPPQIHPSHSTSHMVRQYTPAPSTPQPLTFPNQPPMHTYMPIPQILQQQSQGGASGAFIRQMSPPMSIPMNPHEHQRHFSPPIQMSPKEAYPEQIINNSQQEHQQATNPFSPNAQSQSNNIFHQHFLPPSSQQQMQQQQNFQNIPLESQQQQMPVHPSQQQYYQQQQHQQPQQQSQQQQTTMSQPSNNNS